VSSVDVELRRLLITELERHLVVLDRRPLSSDDARRAVHALKGAAGLANERDLAGVLSRLERRLRDGDETALLPSATIVRAAVDRLSKGESALAVAWPEPPDDLAASSIDPSLREHYIAELHDHLTAIDRVLAEPAPRVEDARALHRHVHTIKGGASSVGDEAIAWFCHGLEERLTLAEPTDESAARVLAEAAKWRATLSMLVEDVDAALTFLRSPASRARTTVRPASSRPASRSVEDEVGRASSDDATIRVSTGSVDRLLDRFVAIDLVRERLASRIDATREQSRELRRLRADLADALRLIGPPRPWGAPAAALRRVEWTATSLASLGEELDQAAHDLRGGDHILKESVTDARQELSTMRLTPLRRLFARLSAAIETESRRLGRTIIVRTEGAGETVDRRVAELLVEPCLQLVRNAVAHGIEEPAARTTAGKSAAGTISVLAKKAGGRLTITIEDDGAGVDIGRVRARAVDLGLVAPEIAEVADDATLLSFVFLPGFSTREASDVVAGRGVGMDICLFAVQRLGGAIRLSTRRGQGFAARIELPVGGGLASVLWVAAGGEQYALPVSRTRAVRRVKDDDQRAPHLATCLENRPSPRATFSVELDDEEADGASARVGVDEVGRTEDVLIRPLSPLIASVGPFAGVIVRGDGSLRLALDVYTLAPRVRTLLRIPEMPRSDRPPALGAREAL
jgi:two-component system, chemotaxis family, sensor kinase CheA